MLTFDQYLRPTTLEEAYTLAQKKNHVVLGGMLWLRLGTRRVTAVIDLSALGLDQIVETDAGWEIGAYTTLRTLETHPALHAYTHGALKDALSSIVGVQFRNLATVGGSVFGRYGFSDVVTTLLALDATVTLYHAGTMPLAQFCEMGRVTDILTHVTIPKTAVSAAYRAQRNSATDFPVLNVCAAKTADTLTVAVGARPLRGVPYRFALSDALTAEAVAAAIADAAVLSSNARASEDYRRHLCRVLVRRAVRAVLQPTEQEEQAHG